MKKLKVLLILGIILNFIISVILIIMNIILTNQMKDTAVKNANEEFKKNVAGIQYVTNGNRLLEKYSGNLNNVEISRLVSDFMVNTVPKIAKETVHLKKQKEIQTYYQENNMKKLTGIQESEMNQFITMVQQIQKLNQTELEYESAVYEENSIVDQKSYTSAILKINYKEAESISFLVYISHESKVAKFFPKS